MNAAATALYVLSLVVSGLADNIELNCELLSPIENKIVDGECIINEKFSNCTQYCRSNSYTFGQLNSLGECVCGTGNIFDPNFCCKDAQCQLIYKRDDGYCNKKTNRCETTMVLNSTEMCNEACQSKQFVRGVMLKNDNCTCIDFYLKTMLTDELCLLITSAILGVASNWQNITCAITETNPMTDLSLCSELSQTTLY
ncbi:hypothetical protein CHUAL_006620 [Chamberlinius hualienensis]